MTSPGARPYPGTTDERLADLALERGDQYRDLSMLTITRAAAAAGGSIDWLTPIAAWATFADRKVPFFRQFGAESAVGAAIATSKWLSKQLLLEAGVRVPRGLIARSAAEAVDAQRSFAKPLVIKPVDGAFGHGVTVQLEEPEEIQKAYDLAANADGEVLVEEFVEGEEYRIHATSTRYIGAFRRVPPNVQGDGTSTLRELVEAKNRLREEGPSPLSPIPLNDITTDYLQSVGKSWEYVPAKGEHVVVSLVSSLTNGADSEACGDSLSPEVVQTAIDAVAATPGMRWAGLDVLVDRRTGEAYIIEVNCNAAIDGSNFPVLGDPLDMGSELWAEYAKYTEPLTTAEPEAAKPRVTPGRLPLETFQQTHSLTDLAKARLESQGYTVESREGMIWVAQKPNCAPLWYVGVRGLGDLRISSQVLRERRLLLRALDRNHLPRPHGETVTGFNKLEEYRSTHRDHGVLLLPGGTHNGSPAPVSLAPGDAAPATLFDRWPRWFAQPRHPGLRFRVFATPERTLLALAPGQQVAPEADVLSEACRMAVRTVRAMPQLRWAVVDTVVRSTRPRAEMAHVLVEDVSYRAALRAGEAIVAGSVNDLLETIIASSRDQIS